MLLVLAVLQFAALILLVVRLLPGRTRRAPEEPSEEGRHGALTIVVATLNERHRLEPCLDGLMMQGAVVAEILIVDSGSTDGTISLIADASKRDPRIRALRDDPLPPGWIGKVWALQHGLEHARGEFVLGVDADVIPQRGMAGGVLKAALENEFDAVSFSPRFTIASGVERWLQPSLLVTLVYRFGAVGTDAGERRVMANGQCFLARRSVLIEVGGYASARASFSDDVTLARELAHRGYRVGFLDGSRLYDVRAYRSAREMWREWGRSIDLKDSASTVRQWADVLFLAVVQGGALPAFLLAVYARSTPLLVSSGLLLGVRIMLQFALVGSYAEHGAAFWLSPLADPLAVLRIVLSTLRRPKAWRGRKYP